MTLKTETQVFGEIPPSRDETGKVVRPGRKGLRITSTQMPCSAQREVFARLLSMLPERLPAEVSSGGALRGGLTEGDGLAAGYTVLRRVFSDAAGVKYLSETFGRYATVELPREVRTGDGRTDRREVPEGLSPEIQDEAFGADFSVFLEWLAWSVMFNFSDVLNLLPEWGKEIPSAVGEAADALKANPLP